MIFTIFFLWVICSSRLKSVLQEQSDKRILDFDLKYIQSVTKKKSCDFLLKIVTK